jgi:hypothetical protein
MSGLPCVSFSKNGLRLGLEDEVIEVHLKWSRGLLKRVSVPVAPTQSLQELCQHVSVSTKVNCVSGYIYGPNYRRRLQVLRALASAGLACKTRSLPQRCRLGVESVAVFLVLHWGAERKCPLVQIFPKPRVLPGVLGWSPV